LTKPVELPQGTLEMLILKAVSLGSLHGYGILLRIQQLSGERLEILQGSFYTAIYRLELAEPLSDRPAEPTVALIREMKEDA
jgi:PadR family transcriptional regulator PadR